MSDYVLEIKGLRTYFRAKGGLIKAVDGVYYQLCKGQTLGLVGESGSAKSTIGLSLLGLAMAQFGAWLINTRLFELDYRPFAGASAVMVLATMLLVTAVGMAASVSILRSKPVQFLRAQTEEE